MTLLIEVVRLRGSCNEKPATCTSVCQKETLGTHPLQLVSLQPAKGHQSHSPERFSPDQEPRLVQASAWTFLLQRPLP
jgi:hypothetical protein